MADVPHMLTKLAQHPCITHFELRPLDRLGMKWLLSYRDSNTAPPAYSGGVEGTVAQCLAATLERASKLQRLDQLNTRTRKMKRIT